jgi:hypothetical protein
MLNQVENVLDNKQRPTLWTLIHELNAIKVKISEQYDEAIILNVMSKQNTLFSNARNSK